MILANEAVAHRLVAADSPALFRVHERPAADGLAGLIPVLEEFDWFAHRQDALRAGDPHAVQAVLEASRGRSEGELVGSLLLRAMKRADYRPPARVTGWRARPTRISPRRSAAIPTWWSTICSKRCCSAAPSCTTRRPRLCAGWGSTAPSGSAGRRRRARVAGAQADRAHGVPGGRGVLRRRVRRRAVRPVRAPRQHGRGLAPVRRLGTEYYSLDAELHRLVGQDSGRTWRLGQEDRGRP